MVENIYLLGAAVAAIFYISWSIGSNEASNSIGLTSGARGAQWKKIVLLGSLFVFAGAVLFGESVITTVGTKIISPEAFSLAGSILIATVAAIIITLASYKALLPISTTQAIIGGVIGYGLATSATINWGTISAITLSWIVSPIIGMGAGFLVYFAFQDRVTLRLRGLLKRERLESVAILAQLLSVSLLAFAYGTNDLANAVGIFSFASPTTLEILGATGLALGILTWGFIVIRAAASRIIALTPTRGFIAQATAAGVVLIFSYLGMPISTTHVIVGTLFGTGLALGAARLNWRVMFDIFASWIITLPLAAGIAFALVRLIF